MDVEKEDQATWVRYDGEVNSDDLQLRLNRLNTTHLILMWIHIGMWAIVSLACFIKWNIELNIAIEEAKKPVAPTSDFVVFAILESLSYRSPFADVQDWVIIWVLISIAILILNHILRTWELVCVASLFTHRMKYSKFSNLIRNFCLRISITAFGLALPWFCGMITQSIKDQT